MFIERGSDGGGGGGGRSPRMSAQQKEALQGVAGEFNTFKDDGSFMERVAKATGSARREESRYVNAVCSYV